MENLVPTLFHEIYRKCFGAGYDTTQDSGWWWLTNKHICDFSMSAYTRDDLPHACIIMCEGHWPKMFLWMLEEYVYILSRLCMDDQDGLMVLGHELFLLAHSRCCRKREGGWMPQCAGALSLDHLPASSRDTLEHAIHSTKDTIALEHLAWAIYNNQLGPWKSPSLSGFESYRQVLQYLVDKAFKGLQAHCLPPTSAMFKPVEKVRSVVTVLLKAPWTEKYSMTRDMQEEFAGGDKSARGWEQP